MLSICLSTASNVSVGVAACALCVSCNENAPECIFAIFTLYHLASVFACFAQQFLKTFIKNTEKPLLLNLVLFLALTWGFKQKLKLTYALRSEDSSGQLNESFPCL